MNNQNNNNMNKQETINQLVKDGKLAEARALALTVANAAPRTNTHNTLSDWSRDLGVGGMNTIR